MQTYPTVADQLWAWHRRDVERRETARELYRARLLDESFDHQMAAAASDPDRMKREVWEFLALVASVDDKFPAASAFDRFCAELNATRRNIAEAKRCAKGKMDDLAIDSYLAKLTNE